ncbi:MAG: D-2-hydroxyacid dehydrogenase [Verrucomicrobia bacterium]|nr:D-2-hydroxyacid dehydrogenase [Verrucomicrobiota bacterium]
MKAVFLDTDSLGPSCCLDALKELPLEWTFYKKTTPAQSSARAAGATIIVSSKVPITEELLSQAPDLKLICVPATGYNNIDVKKAHALNISVCNVPSYSTASVAQHTLSLLLALSSNLFRYKEAAHKRWHKSPLFTILDYPFYNLEGKTLGIVGYGAIGKRVAELAAAFRMKVLISEHKQLENTVPFQYLLKNSDFITLHLPLTPATRGLIGREQIEQMKPTACLINVSRGGLIHEQALADALLANRLAGAALDVLSVEPPTKDHPLLHKKIPNLILTPHMAFSSVESISRLVAILKENIASFLSGSPQNLI